MDSPGPNPHARESLRVLLGAGLLLYLGRDLLTRSAVLTWGLSFAGTTAVGILAMALHRVLAEL